LTLTEKIFGLIPVFVVIVAITISFITQEIWIKRKYRIYLFTAAVYCTISLWISHFNFSSYVFLFSLLPIFYLINCFSFEKLFSQIKPKYLKREYPIYTVFTSYGDEVWEKRVDGTPISEDRVVSAGLALTSIFIPLFIFLFWG
jgi:hypothetical protein